MVWIRLKPVNNVAVIAFNTKEKQKSRIPFLLNILSGLIVTLILLISAIKKYLLGNNLSDIIAILMGILIPTTFIGNNEMLSSDFCKNINNWQRISSIKLIGNKKSKLIYSLTINNEDYIVSLNEKEINKLRIAGFII